MKNKFKKLTGLFLAAVMTLVALPIQTLASEWGVAIMSMRLCSATTSDQTAEHTVISVITHTSITKPTAMLLLLQE